MKTDLLLSLLIKKQEAENLSHTEFAQSLGISRALWDLVRTGKRGFGEKTLSGIVRSYPELIPELLIFLRGDAGKGAESRRKKKDSR